MSTPKLKVLICGAGIAGPSLAYWLTHTNLDVSVTIVERAPIRRVTGQAIDIRGRAVDVIKLMKLEDKIRSFHTTEVGTEFINTAGKQIAEFAMTGDRDSMTSEYEILRADLSQLLLEQTEELEQVKFVYGDAVERMEQDEEKVDVTFASGKKESFDLLVAADGSSSRTRSFFLDAKMIEAGTEFIGQYIAFFSIPREAHDTKTWKWVSAPKGLAMMTRPHRTPDTMGAYFAITTPGHNVRYEDVEAALEQGTTEARRVLHKYFEGAGWEAERLLKGMDAADDFYMNRMTLIRLPKWQNGRAVVLGDAAFATFGIGTSLAMESAYVLAGELSKIASAADVPAALLRYEEVFRPSYEAEGSMPSIFPQAVAPQSEWALWLRDTLLWAVGKSKVYKFIPKGNKAAESLPTYDWKGL